MTPRLSAIQWKPSWRLVSSRFPPVCLYDRVSSAEDLDIISAIEGLTNDRLREEIGALHLVPDKDRIYGPGTTPIMAAFTHLNPEGSRFTNGTYGVYYAAKTIDTAIAETLFHKTQFLAATKEPPVEIDMRSYASEVDAQLHDIRNLQVEIPDIYDHAPAHYGAAQSFAKKLRDNGSNGIVYSSVRDLDGECIAVFRPSVMSPVVQGKHYCYVWDGERMVSVYVKTEYPE